MWNEAGSRLAVAPVATLFLLLAGALFPAACSAGEEPPYVFGEAKPGQELRAVELVSMNSSDGYAIYEIQYPTWNLTSKAKVGFRTAALREEVFEGKWKITYHYEEHPEIYHAPSRYTVYAYSAESKAYDKVVNEYRLEAMEFNSLTYVDSKGKMVKRDPFYFEVGNMF